MSNSIVGAKKKERKPRIAVDSAASVSTAKLLYGLAEGEVYGLADGARSIRLDGTPLLDDNGNGNFNGVRWTFAAGTNDQEHISGFPDVTNEIGVGVELRSDNPWIKAFNDTQLSAVRVRFKWGRLSKTNPDNGDVNGYTIKYAIDLQTDGGAYHEIINTKIQEKTSAGYERTHRIDLPKAKTGWQLRVRRLTPNSTSEYVQDTMMVDAIAEVIDVKLSYPNTALLGIEYNAEIFSSVAKVAVRVKGKIIRVPDNYDPVARTYAGIWTGNFKDAYSNNPAWVFYDLCTQWRGGLGERLDATMIDKWSLYALGQYCDQPVSDGQGGLEPRFTCNVYLQKQEEAYTVLQNIAGIFRAMSFWTGERIMLDADVPQDSIYTYSSANIVGGVAGIQYSGTRNRDRHTLAKVAWDNPNNDYQTEYEYIRDEKAMSKFGVKVLDLSAFGCTSQAQAQRAGLWALKTEQLETRQVTFSVGLDGTIPRVGNIISLSDEAFAGRANGGRVSTVNGTQRIIELDREVTASVGDVLIINGGSGKSERRNISNVVGNRITVTAGFTSAEPEHVWAIETADLKLMRFRVMSITENDDATYAITAIQHEPQKYDAIDFGTDVKPTDITIVNPDTVDAPDTVSIESRHREVQGQTVTTLVISWAQVSGAVAYDVEWRKDDGTWIKLPRTGNVSAEIEGVYSGNYLARVRSVSAFEVQSQATTSILTEVKGKVGLPPAVVGLTATGVLFGMDLKWGFQAGSGDAAFTEIQVGSAPNVNVATLTQVSYPTNTHTVTGLQGNLKQSYRARLVDKLGFKSPWSAWVTGTTDASADKVMDLIQGQINESSLNQALTSKIEKIETNSSSISGINTEVDKAKADIIEANKVIAANKLIASNAVAEANTEITKAKADIAAADKVIAANKTEAANAVAAANKAIADNKLIASNAVAAANKEIAASKVIIDSNKAEIAASRTELNTAKTQLATAITDINTANTKIADSKLLIDANKAKLVLTDAEVAEAKTKVTALETDYNDNKTSVNNALIVLTDEDKSLASDLSALTASYGASEAKLVQDLKVLTDKDVALTNSVTTLSSSYEANKTKVATDITTLVNKDTALNNLLTTLDSDYKTNKASVSNSLTTLTNKDTSLASDISKLNTKTDNTNAEIVTVKNLVSDNTSSIATTKTDITAAYKQAIDDIEIGGRNYFPSLYLSDMSNWEGGSYKYPKNPIKLEPNGTYTLHIKKVDLTTGWGVLHLDTGEANSRVRLVSSIYNNSNNPRIYENVTRTFTVDETGNLWFNVFGHNITTYWTEPQIFKGTVLQDWTPAPEDIEADYNAKISTEATARADADEAITSSVTALESDYDANKASVSSSLNTLTDKDTALTNQLSDLTSTVGTNTANITDNHSTLVAEDKAIADSVTALDTKYEDNKTSVSNQLIALTNADTALGSRITTLDTDYKGNKTAIRNELTAVSDKANSTASNLTSLTTEVDKNKTAISTEATTRSTEDTALSNRITTVSGRTDNALSRISTAETTIANNTGAITQQKTDITAAYKQAIDDIEIGGRNLFILSNVGRFYASKNNPKPSSIIVEGTRISAPVSFSGLIGNTIKVDGDNIIVSGRTDIEGHIRCYYKYDNSGQPTFLVPVVDGRFEFNMPISSGAHTLHIGLGQYPWVSPHYIEDVKIEQGTKATAWTPAPEDIEADYNAKISTEATARADADEAITSSVTALESDYDANKASVTNSLSTLTSKDTALTNSVDALTTRVGTAEGTITSNNTALVNKDKALTDSLNALTTDYNGNKTTVSNSLSALSTADTALGNRITATDAIAKNAQSRVGTAETAISTANSAIAQQKTDITAAYTKAIDNIEIGGRNLMKASRIFVFYSSDNGNGSAYSSVINNDYFENKPPDDGRANNLYNTGIRLAAPIFKGRKYVVSFQVNTTRDCGVYFRAAQNLNISVPNTNSEWQSVSFEFTASVDRIQDHRFLVGAYNLHYDNTYQFKRWQLEEGNKATDWTPAPEDVTDYVDTSVSNLKTLVDSKASISRVDTVENTAAQALASAKTELTGSYTSAIATAKSQSATDAQTRATKALNDAKADTVLKANAARTAAETYALAEAKSKADAALVTAKSDATTKANAAKSAAETAAALDAKNKADKALADAKVDAKTKADTAERLAKAHADTKVTALTKIVDSKASISSVETVKNDASQALAAAKTALTSSYTEAINGIEIGGRNLIVSSSLLKGKYIVESTGNIAAAGTHTATDFIPVSPSSSYIFSELTVGIFQVRFAYYTSDKVKITGKLYSGAQGKSLIATTPSNAAYMRISGEHTATRSNVATWMFEKGNKATDWTPAPEDVEAAYTASVSAESTARSNADTALGNRITATDAIAKNAQSRIGTAETAISNNTGAIATTNTNLTTKFNEAKDYSDLKSGVLDINSKTKKFINPASYSVDTATITGYLVIETPITPARMVNLKLSGYNYSSKATVGLNLGFYNYTNSFINTGYESTGRYAIDKVQLAKKDADKKAVIIIGLATSAWNYPKLVLEEVIVGYGSTPDSYLNEFSIRVTTDISAYTNITNVSGVDLQGALKENSAAISTEAKARSDADTALGTRITTLDTDYKGNKTAIRTELTAVSNKTNSTATSLGTLTTTVGNNTTKISQESTARSTADTALGNRITATDAIAKNAQSRVGTAETAISNANSAIATLRTDLKASYNIQDTRATNELPSYYYTNYPRQTVREFKQKSVMTGVVGTGTYVYLETVVRWSSVSGGAIVQTAVTDDNRIYIRTSSSASAWRAWVEQEDVTGSAAKVAALKTALDKDIKAVDARVTSEKKVAADATSAVAKTVGTLTTTVNGHTSSIQTQQTSINGLNAQYTVKLDVGGRVSGFGLASSTTQSDFAINADKFYIAPPTGSSKGTSPFMVLTSSKTINGTSVPAGTYIESAFIHNGSIDTAKIDNLAVTRGKIANLAVDTLQIEHEAVTVPSLSYFPTTRSIYSKGANQSNTVLHPEATLSRGSKNGKPEGDILTLSLGTSTFDAMGGSVSIQAFVDDLTIELDNNNLQLPANYSLCGLTLSRTDKSTPLREITVVSWDGAVVTPQKRTHNLVMPPVLDYPPSGTVTYEVSVWLYQVKVGTSMPGRDTFITLVSPVRISVGAVSVQIIGTRR